MKNENYKIDDVIDVKNAVIDWLTEAHNEFKRDTEMYMVNETKKNRKNFSTYFDELIEILKNNM